MLDQWLSRLCAHIFFFSHPVFFFFFLWTIKADEFQGSSSDAGASFMLDVRNKQKLYDSSSIRARENDD